MGKSKRVFKPKHSLKNKKPRYNKKGGGFFGGDDEKPEPAPEMEAPAPEMEAPAPEMEAEEMKAPEKEMEAPGPAPEKECCPCNKGMMDMLNPKDALNKLEGNIIQAQQNAANKVTTTFTDATAKAKETGQGFFSKFFGSSKQAGGRKSKRRTIRKSKRNSKSKGKRKGKGRSKKNKRITRRR
jgi:hypothetical protein